MRPCAEAPFSLRGIEYGGPRPLFCVPLVATEKAPLLAQAKVAQDLAADLVEWRADFYMDQTPAALVDSSIQLRSVVRNMPIVFTLRLRAEGGAREIPQETRKAGIEAVAASGLVDLVDLEVGNEASFLESTVRFVHDRGLRVILSFHDFDKTPANKELLGKIGMMHRHKADVAKIAVMPRTAGDVLRLLEVTLEARKSFPRLPLCTMSMGPLGTISRVAGFLFGSDMAYAAAQESSAPGQIPLSQARMIAHALLQHA
jgi:3-dehydroquinate dehydratase-1